MPVNLHTSVAEHEGRDLCISTAAQNWNSAAFDQNGAIEFFFKPRLLKGAIHEWPQPRF